MFQFNNMPGINDTCKENGTPLTTCLLQCLSDYVFKECACVDNYMIGNNNSCIYIFLIVTFLFFIHTLMLLRFYNII